MTNVTPRCRILGERREGAITDTLRIARPGRNNSPRTTARASADATPGIKPTNGPEVIASVQKDVETRTTADEKIAAGTATIKVDAMAVAATRGVDVTAVAVTDAEKDVDMNAVQKVSYHHGREEQHVDRPQGRHENRQRDDAHDEPETPRSCSIYLGRGTATPGERKSQRATDDSEEKGHLNLLDRRQSNDDDPRADVDLFFGEDKAEEAHDHEQKAETLS